MILANFTNKSFKSICPVYFTVALNKRNAITTDEMDEANATPIIPYLFDKNIFKRILIATPIIPLKAVVFVFSFFLLSFLSGYDACHTAVCNRKYNSN